MLCFGMRIIGMNDVGSGQRAEAGAREAKHPAQTSVGLNDSSISVHQRHRVWRIFERGSEKLVGRRTRRRKVEWRRRLKSGQGRSFLSNTEREWRSKL